MPENTISRRTLAKTAAWSVPVVAVAIAAPMAAASNQVATDIAVSRSCPDLTVLGSVPQFTITSSTGVIPAGTTFTLQGDQLANVALEGTNATVLVVSDTIRSIVIPNDVPSATVSFTGFLGIFALSRFALSLASLPAGYTESNGSNDSAFLDLTGLAAPLGLGYVGLCDVVG